MTRKPEPQERRNVWKAKTTGKKEYLENQKPEERRNVCKAETTGKKECSESQNQRKEGMFGKPKPQEGGMIGKQNHR